MKLRQIDPADLHDAPLNANKMAPDKFKALVESIRRLGFIVPIVVREDDDKRLEIVDGHHRVRAMREIGEATIASIVLEGDEDHRLASLALNRLRGETDLAVASLIIDEMLGDGLDVTALANISGFSEHELNDLVAALDQNEPSLDDIGNAELPEEIGTPVAKPFLLELTFRSREEMTTARKALRKACGKGGELSDGLLRLIGG